MLSRKRRILVGAGVATLVGIAALGALRGPWPLSRRVDIGLEHLAAMTLDGDEVIWSTCDQTKENADGIWRGIPHQRANEILSGLTCPRVLRSDAEGILFLEKGRLVQTSRGGESRPILSDLKDPFVVNRTHVFFASNRGSVRAAALKGGPSREVLAGSVRVWHVDDNHIVWFDGNTLRRTSLEGHASVDLADDPLKNPIDVFVHGENVFWSSCGPEWDELFQTPDCSVWTVPIGGGAPRRLADKESAPTLLASDGDSVFWMQHAGALMQFDLRRSWVPRRLASRAYRALFAAGHGKTYWATWERSGYAIRRPFFQSDAPAPTAGAIPVDVHSPAEGADLCSSVENRECIRVHFSDMLEMTPRPTAVRGDPRIKWTTSGRATVKRAGEDSPEKEVMFHLPSAGIDVTVVAEFYVKGTVVIGVRYSSTAHTLFEIAKRDGPWSSVDVLAAEDADDLLLDLTYVR